MTLQNESVIVGKLTTLGRRTGLPRTVEINLIYLDGKFYATSASVKNKHWCQNMIKNPDVEVNPEPQAYTRDFGVVPLPGVRNIHPRAYARGVLWYGVKAGNRRVSCRSRLVTEEKLRIQVLQLRDSPPLLGRAVFEMSPVDE